LELHLSYLLALGIADSWEGSPDDFLPLEEFASSHGALAFNNWPDEVVAENGPGWIGFPAAFQSGFSPVLHRAIGLGCSIVFNLAGITRASTMTFWEVTQFQIAGNSVWLDHTTFYENAAGLAPTSAQQRMTEILAS
jgi:hypothetical protein